MKKLAQINKIVLALVLLTAAHFGTRACSPLNTPVLTASLISGNNLLLNMNSVTLYNCTYSVQIELVCNGSPMTGNAPFYYISPGYNKNSNPYTIPQMTVSLAGLCQGGVYQYRWREVDGCCIFSPWSVVNSFTMPGVPVPTTLTLNASPPAICFPQTSQLTASVSGGCGGGGPVSFTWIPAVGLSCNTCSNPVANPSVTTTYTCIASGIGNTSCWTASAAITVISFTSPPAVGTMTAPAQLCVGQSNTVSVSSFSGSIQWQQSINGGAYTNIGSANQATITTGTLTAGSYCYRIVASGCGSTFTSSAICTNVNPLPNVTATSASICAGQAASLSAGGAASFAWSAGANPTGVNTATASPGTNTAYTVTGTTNGCTATAIANVSVFPYPVVNPTSNAPVCNGNPVNLATTGSGTFQWFGPNGFSSTLQNPVIPVGNPANNGTYTIIVISNNCATTNTISIVVLNPTVSTISSATFCAGQTLTVNCSSSPLVSYGWSGPGGFSAITQAASIPNVQASASGVYTISVTDGTCSSSATTAITVYPLPNSSVAYNGPVCENTNLTFTATGGVSYVWTGPNNFLSGSPNPAVPIAPASASGIYSVAVTDQYGCIRGFSINAIVLPLPQISVHDAIACMYGSAAMSANGGVTYNWSGPNGFTSNSPNIYFTNLTNAQVGTYSVIVTGANSCTNMAGATLSVFPIPQPTAWCTPEVCIGGKVTFSAQGGALYNWYGPNGFVAEQANTTLDNAYSTSYSGTYTLGVIDDKGCQGFTTVNLLVRALPVSNINASVNKLCVPFCSQFSLTTSGLQNVQWGVDGSGGNTGSTYFTCFNQDGNHIVKSTFSDVYGCTNSNTFLINAYPIPGADFHIANGDPVEGDLVDFRDASTGSEINQWTWFFADNNKNAFTKNPSFAFEYPGTYPVTLIVSNKWGCKDTVTKPVFIDEGFSIYVPDVFTPNGDGVNDVFTAKGYGFTKFHMDIFDEWGELIFSSNDIAKGWDGFKSRKLSQQDVYVWKIAVTDNKGKQKEFTGHVSLLK
jgi:gliding motility-associated-like protein